MTSVRIKRIRPDPNTKGLDLRALIRKEQLKEARAVKRDYESTTATWQTDVDFKIDETPQGANVGTDNKVYGYVDKGTRPHIIRPKNAARLRFNTVGFTPKSKPGVIKSYSGSPVGPPTAYALQVKHPGTKGRKFTQTIQKRSEKRFASSFNHALAKMLRSKT